MEDYMKRKLITLMLACALTVGSAAGCSSTSSPAPATVSGTETAAPENTAADPAQSATGTDSAQSAADTDPAQSAADTDPAPGTADAADPSPSAAPAGSDGQADAADDASGDTASITFEAVDMDGNTVTSDIFSDSRLTMLNVWATYCGPCLNEMPDLGELAQEYDPEDFQLLGIVSDVMEVSDSDVISNAQKLISQTGAAYPHLYFNVSLYNALLNDVMAVPTTFFFDQDGTLIDTVVGSRSKAEWKEYIDGLLETQ